MYWENCSLQFKWHRTSRSNRSRSLLKSTRCRVRHSVKPLDTSGMNSMTSDWKMSTRSITARRSLKHTWRSWWGCRSLTTSGLKWHNNARRFQWTRTSTKPLTSPQEVTTNSTTSRWRRTRSSYRKRTCMVAKTLWERTYRALLATCKPTTVLPSGLSRRKMCSWIRVVSLGRKKAAANESSSRLNETKW